MHGRVLPPCMRAVTSLPAPDASCGGDACDARSAALPLLGGPAWRRETRLHCCGGCARLGVIELPWVGSTQPCMLPRQSAAWEPSSLTVQTDVGGSRARVTCIATTAATRCWSRSGIHEQREAHWRQCTLLAVQNASVHSAALAQLDDLAAVPLRSCASAGRLARSRAPWGAGEG